jgi:uncharacterized membrane protein YdjX (TVP38/TMEM64 family)
MAHAPEIPPETGRPAPLHFGPRRLAAAGILAAIVAILMAAPRLHEGLLSVLEAARRVAEVAPWQAALLVIVFAAASAMLAFVSTALIVPFVVYTWPPAVALLLLWTGWLLGGVCAYTVGRVLGRPVIRTLLSADVMERYEKRFTSRMSFGMVLLVQLALPSEIPGYLLGAAGYSFLAYIAALGLAELPYALATVFIGLGLVARELTTLIGVAVAALVLGGYSLARLHRRLTAD